MKLSCLQTDLNKGLAIVGRAVAARTTLPITNNVLLSAEQSRLKLVATNLEMAISYWIGGENTSVTEEGAITVPARLLTDFVGSLPSDRFVDKKGADGHFIKVKEPEKIEINISPRGKTLELKCGHSNARISGIDAKDFPPIPTVADGVTTTVKIGDLRKAIKQVVFAAATEESRPVLTGVDVQLEGETLTLAAADGFRLAVYKLTLDKPVAQKMEVIIPAKTLAELSRLMGEGEETIDIIVNPNKSQVLFHLKDLELVSQLIQGNFPQYSQLIPKPSSNTTKAVVDVGEFLRTTRTASIFARDGSGIVRMVITPNSEAAPGKVTISARSEEIGENTGEIGATVTGDEAKIAFNGKYLVDVLSVLQEHNIMNVDLETINPSSPGVIRPEGSTSYIHVVMPMFVQW